MESDFFEELFPLIVLVAVVLFIGWLLLRIKRSGRSMQSAIHGALYDTYNKNKREAAKQVIEQQVKKMEEQENDKPIE